ncbi:hypothetical protein JOD55_001706 [Arcanobacterium pluranimalium]|uniref:Rv3235 family protein n=1 Tax=Arcanobacterium pluranimalium TaxID=108028 RepID=UPI00195C534E|nr:Rv3235 family protein [Arcanobacterium pluranimalium]MBM7825879.1 hypothetical protein [Arcanobacterium pluranimalium]
MAAQLALVSPPQIDEPTAPIQLSPAPARLSPTPTQLTLVSSNDAPEVSINHPVYQETAITSKLPRSKRHILPTHTEDKETTLRAVSDLKPEELTTDTSELSDKYLYDRTAFHSHINDPYTRTYFTPRQQLSVVEPIPDNLPSAGNFAASILLQVIEILLGHRPARQLQTWLTPAIFDSLARRAELGNKIQGKPTKTLSPRILKTHTCQINAHIAEVSAVIHDGRKTRAAALRLEVRRQKWHVTALEII